MAPDPLTFTAHWSVRQYEVDHNGHVNNAVYLNYAEELAARHSELSGFGQDWSARQGGSWVIRRQEITYLSPARFGDELELTVRVELVRGARVRERDGRPAPVPRALVEFAAGATEATRKRRQRR